jgi:plasmid stabilization system protein ParE
MPYKIFYLDEAKRDIKEIKTWYKAQRNGLQQLFAKEVTKAIYRIEDTPLAFAVRYKNFRVAHTKSFPYGIHFYIDEPNLSVIITAVIHDYQNISANLT